jgi:Tfp pilus assembly protein PilX
MEASMQIRFTGPGRQRGAAALGVALILLFGITLIGFYTNRGMIFEQRTSANQYRSTLAFEMAEAGLEWVVGRLNTDALMAGGSSCATTGTLTQSFAERYLPYNGAKTDFVVNNTARPSCSVAANGTLTCSCPPAGTNPTVGAAEEPRFLVQFNPVAGELFTVEIVSWGCTGEGAPCTPGSTARPDGQAVVRAIYKMKNPFANAPGAGLVTGLAAVTGGSLRVVNMDPKSNGITIHSGASVELGTGTDVVTLPGTSPRASILDNDPTLNSLATADPTGDKMFASFFGETIDQYKNNEKTWLITSGSCNGRLTCTQCGTANSCGTAISNAYNNNYQRFWTDTDASFQNNLPAVGTLGTADKPIAIASSASIELKAALVAYGLIYAATASADGDWDYAGSGNGKIFGALVSRSSFTKGGTGNLTVIYDGNLFGPGPSRGTMVRVPGSWRDSTNEL